MKEFHVKVLAKHYDPESCVINRKVTGEALTGAHAGRVLSSEIRCNQGADTVEFSGRQHEDVRYGECILDPAESETSSMHGNSKHENREALISSISGKVERCMKARRPTMQMYDIRESDKLIVPMKWSNKCDENHRRRL